MVEAYYGIGWIFNVIMRRQLTSCSLRWRVAAAMMMGQNDACDSVAWLTVLGRTQCVRRRSTRALYWLRCSGDSLRALCCAGPVGRHVSVGRVPCVSCQGSNLATWPVTGVMGRGEAWAAVSLSW